MTSGWNKSSKDDPFKNIQWHPVGSNGTKPLLRSSLR
jgi:hypothetical protein